MAKAYGKTPIYQEVVTLTEQAAILEGGESKQACDRHHFEGRQVLLQLLFGRNRLFFRHIILVLSLDCLRVLGRGPWAREGGGGGGGGGGGKEREA